MNLFKKIVYIIYFQRILIIFIIKKTNQQQDQLLFLKIIVLFKKSQLMKTINDNQDREAAQYSLSRFSIQKSLKQFYIDDLMLIIKGYNRGKHLSLTLIFLKTILQFIIIFNNDIATKLVLRENYLSFVQDYNVLQSLQSNQGLCQICQIILLSLNSLLLIYIFCKFIYASLKNQKKNKYLKLLIFINEREKLIVEQNQKLYDIVFSFFFSIYMHIILIPSIIFSGILVGRNISSVNLSLTLIIGLLISNNDYDFLVMSKDALRQKYSGFQTVFQLFEMICYFISIVINTSSSLLILILIFVSEILRLIILKPYFSNRIQILQLFINNYLLKFVITLLIIINIQQQKIHYFSFLVIIFLPISYKISEIIQSHLTQGYFQNFENYLFNQEEIKPSSLNYLTSNFAAEKQSLEHAEIKAISYLIQYKQLTQDLSNQETLSNKTQRFQFFKKIQKTYLSEDKNNNISLLGNYKADQKVIEGKEYVFKEQAYGKNEQLKQEINQFFLDIFQTQRKNNEFGMIDIYYLVFIIEILQNFTKFEMVLTQSQKFIDVKYSQIISSIKNQVQKHKDNLKLIRDEKLIFSPTYYQALLFDELINQAFQNLEQAIQKKIQLLVFMKSRYIDLEQIQSKLEELLTLRKTLIEQISLLIRVNEYNSQLYDIYLNYLETISFSDSDIHLMKYNKFQKQQEQKLYKINSSHTCILYASLKTEKQRTKICKVSNNFYQFFGFKPQLILNKPIEVLMPAPIANIHSQFITKFFDSGRNTTNLVNSILFALTQSNHIIPINIDFKVNMISVDNEFGITSLLHKVINQCQYILFDANTSRLISMTYEISQFIFPSLKSFEKVNLTQFFPIIQQFRSNQQDLLSSHYSKTSQLTQKTNKSQRMFSNAISIKYTKIFTKNNVKNNLGHAEKSLEKKENVNQFHKKEENKEDHKNEFKNLKEIDQNELIQLENISFLLIVNQNTYPKQSSKNKTYRGLSSYQFFTMNISIRSLQVQGLENIKYIEITQIKQINPISNSRLIRSIYNSCVEGYETNFHYLNYSDVECILSELDQSSLYDETLIQNGLIENSDIGQLSKVNINNNNILQQPDEDNSQVLFNRYASNTIYKQSKQISQDFSISQKGDKDSNDFKSHYKGLKQRLGNSQKNQQSANDIKRNQQNNKHDTEIDTIEQQNISQFISNNHDQSQQQFLKFNAIDTTNQKNNDNFQDISQINIQTQHGDTFMQRSNNQYQEYNNIYSQFEFPQQRASDNEVKQPLSSEEVNQQNQGHNQIQYNTQNQNDAQLLQSLNFHLNSPFELIQSPQHQTLSPMNNQHAVFSILSPNIQSPLNTYNNNQNNHAQGYLLSQISNNNFQQSKADQSTQIKSSIQQNQNQNSNYQLINNNTSQILSPVKSQNQILQNQFLQQFSNQQELRGSKISNEIVLNDLLARDSINIMQKQITQQSCRSLSKKRKLIQIQHKNEIKHIKNALDSSSNHSRETSSSNQTKTTKSIILQKHTLGIMKFVQIVGLLSFFVLFIVVVQQFFSIQGTLQSYQNELNYVDWATQYKIGISLVMKYNNYGRLIDGSYLIVSQNKTFKKTETALSNQNCIDSVNTVGNLLAAAFQQGSQRKIFSNIIGQQYTFQQGSQVDRSQQLSSKTAYNIFSLVPQQMILFQAVIILFAYLYRYSRNVGTGTPQFIVVNNSEQITSTLIQLSSDVQQFSLDELQNINQQLLNELFIIIILSGVCIFVILPVYSFIQSKREQIISLFGTFSSNYIDSCIQDMKRFYQINNNYKQQAINDHTENVKRQILSQTSKLSRTNMGIIMASILVFVLTLPYPILNKVLAQQYIEQYQLLNMESFVIDETSYHLFTLLIKQSKSTSFDFRNYIPKLQAKISQQKDIYVQFQQSIQDLINVPMSDQSYFDNIYSQIYQNDICQIYIQNPSYFNSVNSTFTPQSCSQIYQNTMSKGLTISIKIYFEIMEQFYYVFTTYNNTNLFNQTLLNFQQQYYIPDVLQFQDFIVYVIKVQRLFLTNMNSNYNQNLQTVLIGLLFYQILIMILILYFGWVAFYIKMDEYLHKTKLYLAVLNIRYLIQNPYVQNYLHKNLQ
ncbi:transmembrane protein, putative (macronuclear) [Tetrahymena thermophila SB210]|uniref:Transmembrane protein, putative n=1 Tax=Tetrahymena thermophila (strain SB210) TaxID=312017 RepID=I7LXC0_TETTS|nr:transmembrane protein, putative [Tetrahymena thermophila SB210]EAS04339.2 transmembrane protein, putative [Tetrahymena thermophila SB210]|eukprot:XP_001024584.2 transmembrane protein, putative [Tetrahymena thermophila SB210]